MKRVLIADQHQFGYLTDTYSYCRWLRHDLDITVVCWDYGEKRITLEGVSVVYVSRNGGRPRRLLRYLRRVAEIGRSQTFDVWFIVQFFGCSLLRLTSRRTPKIADIRTGSEQRHVLRRTLENRMKRLECSLFCHISLVSESLGRVLGFARDRYTLLPLGGDLLDIPAKTFESLRLFYVGTLIQRDIHKTVEGLTRFLNEYDGPAEVSYDIVGDGHPHERSELLESIQRSPWKGRITFHGRIPNAHLRPFLERANVGVAFVPMTPFFDCQPSTKVFEYLLAGIPVLATATSENAAVIGADNGVLHTDTAEGFCNALRELAGRFSTYRSGSIKAASMRYSWEYISRNTFLPLIQRVADGHG